MNSVWLTGILMVAQAGGPSMDIDGRATDWRDREPVKAEQETNPTQYRKKAKALYGTAQSLLQRELGIEAAQTFQLVIEKYPFSRYAILAEFGHAKALAVQGESEGALAGFSRFLKQHPGHPRTADVRHAVVTTHWSERPGTFVLLPPPHERDLADARAAVAAAQQFLRMHPDDDRQAAVRKIKSQARQLLYRQAVFLARWTHEQGRSHAALKRWKLARQEFADQAASPKDVQWAKQLEVLIAARPLKKPEAPKLHPPEAVVGKGDSP